MDKDDHSVMFTKGLNVNELVKSGTVFEIDINFYEGKKKLDPLITKSEDLLLNDFTDDDDDSDPEGILKNVDDSIERTMLTSPEYASFKELAVKMTDCIPSGDVKLLIEDEGSGPLIPYDAEVTLHYAAYWEKQRVPFDSTLTMNYGAPLVVRLSTGNLLPGLEIALTTIHGPTARFHTLLTPVVAWGKLGVPPRIKPEPCLFTVTVINVIHVGAAETFNEMPSSEQKKFENTIKAADASNVIAKENFKKKQFKKALRQFHQTLHILQLSRPETDEEKKTIEKYLHKVYINLVVCYYKLNMPDRVIMMCDDLGRIVDTEKICKAQYYYAKAFTLKGEYETAEKFYKKALKLEPRNSEIGKAMAELDNIIKKSAKEEKNMWRSVFQNGKEVEDLSASVDEEFKKTLNDTCEDLAGRTEYTKMDLPPGLSQNEVDYIKSVIAKLDNLVLVEDGQGTRKKISLIKKI